MNNKRNMNIIITDSKFIIKNDEGKRTEFNIYIGNHVPFIPFYHYIWEDEFNKQYINTVIDKIQEISKISKFRKGIATIYMSVESSIIEKKAIEDFIYTTGLFNDVSVYTCGEAARQNRDNVICLSSSERAIALEVFGNGKKQSTHYYNPYLTTKELILEELGKLSRLPLVICDVNNQLEKYYSLGEVVNII